MTDIVSLNGYLLCKIVWRPERNNLLDDLKNNDQLSKEIGQIVTDELSLNIDIEKWFNDYYAVYLLWLDDLSNEVYDINSSVNLLMRDAVKKTNEKLASRKIALFYWFDVDRTIHPGWEWIDDPIDHKPLQTLDSSYADNNRKIALDHFMVFPAPTS